MIIFCKEIRFFLFLIYNKEEGIQWRQITEIIRGGANGDTKK